MKLRKWVRNQGGAYKLAPKLGVKPRTVYRWLQGLGSPTLGMSYCIVIMSRGTVTFEDIFRETRRNMVSK